MRFVFPSLFFILPLYGLLIACSAARATTWDEPWQERVGTAFPRSVRAACEALVKEWSEAPEAR